MIYWLPVPLLRKYGSSIYEILHQAEKTKSKIRSQAVEPIVPLLNQYPIEALLLDSRNPRKRAYFVVIKVINSFLPGIKRIAKKKLHTW